MTHHVSWPFLVEGLGHPPAAPAFPAPRLGWAISALLFLVGLGGASPAHAQQVIDLEQQAVDLQLSVAVRDDPAVAAEWSSIEAESHWATGLYVTGAIASGLGAGGLALGAVFVFEPAGNPLAIAGAVGAGLGFLMIHVAIGLDADSGSRRRGLVRRATSPETVRLGLGLGTIALEGRF